MPRPDADTRSIHYRFANCRAAIAARHPGTPEWRHRFWLREIVSVTGELGMALLGAFALWYVTQHLSSSVQVALDSFGLLLLSGRLRFAISQLFAETRAFHNDVAYYAAHRAYVDAQI